MRYIKQFENFHSSIKQRLLFYYENDADYLPEEIKNVEEILDGYDDNLSGLSYWDKVLLLRIVDDEELHSELDNIEVNNSDDTDELFEDNTEKIKLSFEEVKNKILELYPEDKIIAMFDEEVASGNWIDSEQMEDEGYENESEYYTDYGRGEAESAVAEEILSSIKRECEFDFDPLGDDTDIYDWLRDTYHVLYNM